MQTMMMTLADTSDQTQLREAIAVEMLASGSMIRKMFAGSFSLLARLSA